MSELLAIEIPRTPPPGWFFQATPNYFVPIYEKPIPTNVQVGERWMIERVSARVALFIEEIEGTEQQITENEHKTVYKSEAEAIEAIAAPYRLISIERPPLAPDGPSIVIRTVFKYEREGATVKTIEEQFLSRTAVPFDATLLIEIVSSGETLYSCTIPGTFRASGGMGPLQEEGAVGTAEFPFYGDLTNPLPVGIEKLSLRISIFMTMKNHIRLFLRHTNTDPLAGFVNLFYDKEVK